MRTAMYSGALKLLALTEVVVSAEANVCTYAVEEVCEALQKCFRYSDDVCV